MIPKRHSVSSHLNNKPAVVGGNMTSSFKQFWSTTKQFWSTAVAIAVFMGLIAVITIVLVALAANARPLPDGDSTLVSEYSSIGHTASTDGTSRNITPLRSI